MMSTRYVLILVAVLFLAGFAVGKYWERESNTRSVEEDLGDARTRIEALDAEIEAWQGWNDSVPLEYQKKSEKPDTSVGVVPGVYEAAGGVIALPLAGGIAYAVLWVLAMLADTASRKPIDIRSPGFIALVLSIWSFLVALYFLYKL